jgi:hypothetical protein
MDPSTAWEVGASKAASTGLKNASALDALVNLFYSPPLGGGSMTGNMGLDIGGGVWRSARSPDRLIEALEDGKMNIYWRIEIY